MASSFLKGVKTTGVVIETVASDCDQRLVHDAIDNVSR